MPIEIRELVIKATVESEEKPKAAASGTMDEKQRQMIIAECVEKVLELMRLKNER